MSTTKDLIQEVKQAISIHQVAQMLSLPLGKLERDGSHRLSCPVHGKDRSLAIYPNVIRKDGLPGSFTCFASPPRRYTDEKFLTGDCVGLYVHIHGCNNYQAAKAIAEHYGIGSVPGSPPQPQQRIVALAARPRQDFDAEEYLKGCDPEHSSLAELDITADTLREFKGGYCTKRRLLDRLALALCDTSGNIVGFIGLALNQGQEPYIKLPFNDFDPRPYIFGAERVKPGTLLVTRDPLLVLEAYERERQIEQRDRENESVVAILTETDFLMQPTVEALAILMHEKKCTSLRVMF